MTFNSQQPTRTTKQAPLIKVYCHVVTEPTNPGPSYYNLFFEQVGKSQPLDLVGGILPEMSNTEAGYYAMLEALRIIMRHGWTNVTLYSSQNLIINQLSGLWECNAENLKPLYNHAKYLLDTIKPSIRICHIKKEENPSVGAAWQFYRRSTRKAGSKRATKTVTQETLDFLSPLPSTKTEVNLWLAHHQIEGVNQLERELGNTPENFIRNVDLVIYLGSEKKRITGIIDRLEAEINTTQKETLDNA